MCVTSQPGPAVISILNSSHTHNTTHAAASGLPPALAAGQAAAPPGLFTVLGIETSCDDTGVAVVRSDGVVLGEALASQHAIHEQWGGVVPGLARDAHVAVIDAMVAEALKKAGMASAAEVDAVGATVGPGLEICLRVGCEAGKALAVAHDKPFVCVHHLEAHCLMARIGAPLEEPGGPAGRQEEEREEGSKSDSASAGFPFLALLVSGGHCMILECRGVGRYRILGGTLDDALGEAYDKAARLLRIGTGAAGGPAIEVRGWRERRGDRRDRWGSLYESDHRSTHSNPNPNRPWRARETPWPYRSPCRCSGRRRT